MKKTLQGSSAGMRCVLVVAVLATALACTVQAHQFKNPLAQVFNTWDFSKGRQHVENFDHFALEVNKEVHEQEHIRKKRNAAERAQYAVSVPRTVCERPGYTGQFCEFPICNRENPFINEDQWESDEGFYIDMSEVENCTTPHTILVDDTLSDVTIELEATSAVYPHFILGNIFGDFFTPDEDKSGSTYYQATYKNLAAGEYIVVPSVKETGGNCVVTAQGHSHLTISGGFIYGERERDDFPNEFAAVHQFNSIVLHANRLRSPGSLRSVSLIGPNNYVFRPRLLEKRYGCTYEYYFDSMFCYEMGRYALNVEGVDFAGNLFRRSFPFECTIVFPSGNTTVSPFTTPSPAPPSSCKNGGVLVGGKCVCQEHFAGIDCSAPICVNGGTPWKGVNNTGIPQCLCPIGFNGQSCEYAVCEEDAEIGFGTDRPTLIFAIRSRQSMNNVITQVRDAINATLANLNFDSEYLSHFQLVLFNNDQITLNSYYRDPNDLLGALTNASTSTSTDGNCSDAVFGALGTGLTSIGITTKSVVYVITDALADDYDEYAEAIYNYNSYYRATINFVFINPIDHGCSPDPTEGSGRAFRVMADTFNGLAFGIADRNNVYKVMFAHMDNLLYRTKLVLGADRRECANGYMKTIQIASANTQIIIAAQGQNFAPILTDPAGKVVIADEIITENHNFGIWRVRSPLMGQYILRALTNPSTSTCSFRVYQASYKAPSNETDPELFWAITNDVVQDGNLAQPLFRFDNHPVFHLNNFPRRENPDRIFTALTIYSVRDNTEHEVYAANGIWRERCSYNFYFPAFRCDVPNELFHFEFYVRDDLGYYIQRAGTMFCVNTIPTPSPPEGCLNGGVPGSTNGTCICQPHFYGKRCEKIQCENGGHQVQEHCSCTNGWTGYFCETPQCPEEGPEPSYGYHVDMAFVVEITQRGQAQIIALSRVIGEVLRDVVLQNRKWIDRFVLVGYNGTGATVLADVPSDSYGRLVSHLQELANSTITDNSCVVRTWDALSRVLRERNFGNAERIIPRKSVINLYQSGIPDEFGDGNLLAFSVSEELLTRYVTVNTFQYRNPNATNDMDIDNPWMCNGKVTDFTYVEKICRRGDGRFYTLAPEDTGRAAFMIPTLFSSSIVYKYNSNDCSTEQNVYFPVDGYTQTVSAIIVGENSTVSLKKFDGSTFGDDSRVDIYHDSLNNIVEFRNPCDTTWKPLQQYCMRFSANEGKIPHDAALSFCANDGAFLADDQSPAKHAWIKQAIGMVPAWLGLQYINGHWMFVSGETTAVASQNYWKDGVVPNGNTDGKKCAYFNPNDGNGIWVPIECDTKQTFYALCQQHRFDINHVPNKIGDDDISPGKYFFTVKTQGATNHGWKGCQVEVRVQSDLNIEYGFIDGIRKDEPVPIGNKDSANNRVATSISVGRAKSLASVMHHVMLRTEDFNSTLLEAATYAPRRACSYEWYSQEISCDPTGGEDFQLVHLGEDDTGNTFQRYTTTFCGNWIFTCANGGVYSNGGCVCADYFTGDRCELPLCQNGGTLENGRRCRCPEGYSGEACQFATCPRQSSVFKSELFNNNGKALVLILESSQNTQTALQNLASKFVQILVHSHQLHPGWFSSYIIHAFYPDGTYDGTQVSTNPDAAAAAIAGIAAKATQPGVCELPLFEAMKDIFTYSNLLDGSEFLLITSAVPIDNDQDNVNAAEENFGTHHPVVDYIHIDPKECNPTQYKPELVVFGHFIESTGGVIFRTTQDNISTDLMGFLPSRYAPQRLSYSAPDSCQQGVFYVQIDANMTDVYIGLSGLAASASIVTPKYDLQPTMTVVKSDIQLLLQFTPEYPGLYQITVSSPDALCFPTVYGNGGVQVIFGFIQNTTTSDNPTAFAVFGQYNYPVFALVDPDDSRFERGFLYTVNLVRHKLVGSDESPYTSDVNRRARCTYDYIGEPFLCSDNYEALTLSVSGADTLRQSFTRQMTSWCKSDVPIPPTSTRTPVTGSTKPPPPPVSTSLPVTSAAPVTVTTVPTVPPTTTKALTPKDILFDIVFLIDETEDEKFNDNIGMPFIRQLMKIYSVNQAYSRVGIITLPSSPGSTMPVSFLSAIDNYDMLLSNLVQLDDFWDGGNTELLGSALQYASVRYSSPSNGYRSTINNHLIVLLTAKTSFNAADMNKAKSQVSNIYSDHSYGIIAVGYGPNANKDALVDLVKLQGCVFMAPDQATLNGATTKAIQDKIWGAFTTSSGNYCM